MTPCEQNGINGNCGMDCPALIDGDCENEEMLAEKAKENKKEQNHDPRS